LTLLGRVFEQLRREYDDAGRAATFRELHVVLTRGPQSVPYGTIADRLGTSEGAVRVAVHRLRRRYGLLLRREIAATVDNPAEIDDEIRALFAALET
jgi:RNA polymerase sigma-70 factor (ECF subfamily)